MSSFEHKRNSVSQFLHPHFSYRCTFPHVSHHSKKTHACTLPLLFHAHSLTIISTFNYKPQSLPTSLSLSYRPSYRRPSQHATTRPRDTNSSNHTTAIIITLFHSVFPPSLSLASSAIVLCKFASIYPSCRLMTDMSQPLPTYLIRYCRPKHSHICCDVFHIIHLTELSMSLPTTISYASLRFFLHYSSY